MRRSLRWSWSCASAIAAIAAPDFAAAVPILGPNGHHYELIETPMTWENARAAALGMTYLGGQGHLANVTSAEENLFISGMLNAANAWLGGSDVATPDTWVWADGPESGIAFWQGLQGGAPVGGAYTSWGANDPNDSGTNQYALLMCAQNTTPCINENLGEWIDRPGSDLHDFVVEYIAVPEPSTRALLVLGLVGMAWLQRRSSRPASGPVMPAAARLHVRAAASARRHGSSRPGGREVSSRASPAARARGPRPRRGTPRRCPRRATGPCRAA